MIDKAIGVIPPRNELISFPDKKTESSKDNKSEFESLLNQSSRQSKEPDKKERSDQALGGTKKKVQDTDQKLADKSEKTQMSDTDTDTDTDTEGVEKKRKIKLVNEEMVLGSMASVESVNKTPDFEVNLDNLKKTNLSLTAEPQVAVTAMPTPAPKMSQVSDEALASLIDMKQPQEEPTEDLMAALTTKLSDFQAETISMESKPQAANEAEPVVQLAALAAPLELDVSVVETEVVPAVASVLPAESKIFETLNREQIFQKLETLKKMEDTGLKTEFRSDTNGIFTDQLKAHPASSDVSTSFHSSPDPEQDDFQHNDKEKTQLGSVSREQSHILQDFVPVTEAHINHPTVAKDADAANLTEVLNQAQYLVTQGGGEVTVKMTPEGMGEVQLKVMLENGKMSVEMNTHDKNVQKLIQESLSDLKSSLAAHQISVEHVTLNNKISTVYEAENAHSAQNFTDAHAHHQSQHRHQRDQRQQAGQVLEYETMKALPLARNEINKASAHRIYQNNKANSLNAVA